MAEQSAIEWTHATFNPWLGCTKLSRACDHCYAETLATNRLGVTWGAGAPRRRTAASTWKQPLAWNRKAAKEGRRARVFCASLADVFDAEVSDDWRDDLFALIAATPHLDWLLLTKRPKVMRDYADSAHRCGEHWLAHKDAPPVQWPLPNVWLGTTVEDQKMADLRIPLLLDTPAAVRFLSMEPLLGPVDLRKWFDPWTCADCEYHGSYNEAGPDGCGACGEHDAFGEDDTCRRCGAGDDSARPSCPACGSHRSYERDYGFKFDNPPSHLDWVITGGESGPNARPTHPDWFRSIRDQCAAAEVPFLFKQWGEWREPLDGEEFDTSLGRAGKPPSFIMSNDGTVHCFQGDHTTNGKAMICVGKKPAGRHLDGVLHDGYPALRKAGGTDNG